MRTLLLSGIGLGCLMSAMSWFGNLGASVPGWISVFPDLITLAALPVLVFLTLLFVAYRQEGAKRANVRRAGMIIVSIGAGLFAVAYTILGIVCFSKPAVFMVVVGFVMAFVSFVAVGWLSVWAVSAWLSHAGSKR